MFSTRTTAAGLSIVSNTLLVLLKLTVGVLTGSVSVLSEGVHSGVDLLAALIAFFSIRAAAKPADEDHAFGHGKIENISGTVEAGLIFLAAGVIIYQAVRKIIDRGEPEFLQFGIGLMAVSAVVNFFVSRHLHKGCSQNRFGGPGGRRLALDDGCVHLAGCFCWADSGSPDVLVDTGPHNSYPGGVAYHQSGLGHNP